MMNLFNKLSSLKNVSEDVTLNILASLLSTGVMQFVLYPQLAIRLGDELYGEMLTVMGIVSILSLSLGNNLCNARIILNEKYKEKSIVGDFQVLAFFSVVITFLILGIANIFFKWRPWMFVGIVAAASLISLKSYYLVAYRIDINYKKNLYANVVMAIFYILGAFVLIRFLDWPWLFTIPCLMVLIYIYFSSSILKEPFKTTTYFKSSSNVVLMLILSGLIGNVTLYLDRLIVYPILGGSSVSYYTVAAFFSKSFSIILLPISSGVLTYIASEKIKMNKRRFNQVNLILLPFILLFLLLSVTLGPYVTKFLYPMLIESSTQYIFLASLGVIIGTAVIFNGTVVLAKAPSYWQVILSGTKLLVYFVLCLLLVRSHGIYGLCIGIIITNLVSLIMNWMVGSYYLDHGGIEKA